MDGGTDGGTVGGQRDRAGNRESGRERKRSQTAGRDRLIARDHWRDEPIERLVGQKGERMD